MVLSTEELPWSLLGRRVSGQSLELTKKQASTVVKILIINCKTNNLEVELFFLCISLGISFFLFTFASSYGKYMI